MRQFIRVMAGAVALCILFLAPAFAQEAEEEEVVIVIEEEAEGERREVILESAERIRYDSQQEKFEAFGNVTAIQGKNHIITQEMDYDLQANTGIFLGGVTVTREDTIILAREMEGDFDGEIYLFREDVELQKEREEDEGTSTIFWRTALLHFQGDTEEAWSEDHSDIEWKDITISAAQVRYYPGNEETAEEERMEMSGDILILEKDREIRAGTAVYYLDSEILEAENIISARFIIGD